MDEEFLNPEDLTGEQFAPDQTGQVPRWRDQLSAKGRAHFNNYGQSTVEVVLKEEPKGDAIAPPLGPENNAVPKIEELPPAPAPPGDEGVMRGSILRLGESQVLSEK